MSPVRIAEQIRHIEHCIGEAMRTHTDDELRAAAERIGRLDHLPEPQTEMELTTRG